MNKCAVIKCSKLGTERHHVTYSPEVVKLLCHQHHIQITILNADEGRKNRGSLSNKYRWFIWIGFIKNNYGTIRATDLDEGWYRNDLS